MNEVIAAVEPTSTRRRQIVTASAATLAAQLIRVVGGLLVVPILLRRLGVENYGFIALIVSLTTIFVFLESILTPVLRNELVKARATGSTERVDEVMTVGLTAAVGLLLISFPLLMVLSALDWGAVLHVPGHLPTSTAVLAGALVGLLAAATAFADCLYAAWNDLARLRLMEGAATACGLLAVALLTQAGTSPVWLIVLLTIPVPAVRVLAWGCFLRGHGTHPRMSLPTTLNFFWSHRAASAAFSGTQALACAASLFPLILLNSYQGLEEVSLYTVAQRLVGAPANLALAVFPVFWPQLARARELRDRDWLIRTLKYGLWASALGTAAAAALAYVFGPWLVTLWTGNTLVATGLFLALFAALAGAQVMQGWLSTVLNAFGEFQRQFVCYALFTIGSVVCGALGLKAFGTTGLVLGLTFAAALFGIAPMIWLARRCIDRSI